jgi:hypothetical protein
MRDVLFAVSPAELAGVRQVSHAAIQWPSRAARANLTALADDSHSNLGWHETFQALVSHPLDAENRYKMGFGFSTGALVWVVDGAVDDALELASADESAARAWADAHLESAALATTDRAEMPYELDPVDYRGFAEADASKALATLGVWYECGQSLLEPLIEAHRGVAVRAPTVRCWPHHYDLAVLFTLDEGDPETARSVGVGLSPGDDSYAEPYFYCTPWPAPDRLPEAPSPTRWHTEGFTSLVCPASRIDAATDLDQLISSAAGLAFDMVARQ